MYTQPLFLFGLGRVGQALARQIITTRLLHKSRNGLKLNILGMSDSTGLVFNARGLNTTALNNLLNAKAQTGRLPRAAAPDYPALITSLPANTILVDTTASEGVIPALLKGKKRGMGVVLANKVPLVGPLSWWDAIADERSRWETTCGAALPVISTLNTLLNSGDTVQRIEGSLSGTLSFLSSQLEAGAPFGDAVREARARGYTEPDPRLDLSGMDVARKALILARMLGHRLEIQDVKVESLYPKKMNALTVEQFMQNVDSLNESVAAQVTALTAGGKKLRYAAVIQNGTLSAGLVGAEPTAKLGLAPASDCVVVFHTRQYLNSPVTVSGLGAGHEVTASGVLGDIVALSGTLR
jgi:homoserine dehydrogenase